MDRRYLDLAHTGTTVVAPVSLLAGTPLFRGGLSAPVFPRALTTLFWNADSDRLRMPWRLLAGTVLLVGIAVVFGLLFQALVSTTRTGALASLFAGTANSLLLSLAGVLFTTGVTVVGVYLAGRLVDRRRFADFGLHLDRAWCVDFAFGVALGAALMTGIFLVELGAGWLAVTGTLRTSAAGASGPTASLVGGLVLAFALYVLVAVGEELLLRGYLLTNLAEGLRGLGATLAVAVATLLSSAVFGLLHVGNPNATAVSTANVALAGVVLAAGYVLTGELGVSVGFHLSWNFVQGPVFGFPVSGTSRGVALVAVAERGPDRWTGGGFGPEAGLVGVAALVVGLAAIVAWARYRTGSVGLSPAVWTPELRE
ncbi:lysostaphin resistance A-like protein [Halomicrococcus sp. NG-SE-24]|uniref:lysostaphin resistance A-like protein n=1 Tax=Halomicrococcus sp. NG-SE-24 TaxID=3436928 RepID=UPI003D97042D